MENWISSSRLAFFSIPMTYISHKNQSPFGKRHVEQGGAGGEGCAQADFVDQQKWRDGPELIERQYEGEHLLKFLTQALVVESHGGELVAAQRDSHSCRHHHSGDQRGRAHPGREVLVPFHFHRQSALDCPHGKIHAQS